MTKETKTAPAPDNGPAILTSRGETTFTNISGINGVPDTGVITLAKDSDGVFTATYAENTATAKSKAAAVYSLLSDMSGVKINAKLVALESGPMKPVTNDAPEYTADEENAVALGTLAAKIDVLGSNASTSQSEARECVKDIGQCLVDAKALLAVETGSKTNAPAAQAWGLFIAGTETLRRYAKSKNAISEYMRVATYSDDLIGAITGTTNPKSMIAKVQAKFKDVATLAVERNLNLDAVDIYCLNAQDKLQKADTDMVPLDAGNRAVLQHAANLLPFIEAISDEQFEAAFKKAQEVRDAQATKDNMSDAEKKEGHANTATENLEAHFAGLSVGAAADALWSIVNTHGDTEAVLEAFDSLR